MRRYIVEWLAPWIGHDAAALLAPTWFMAIGLAGLALSIMVVRAARRHGDDVPTVVRALLATYVAAVLGGILLPLLADSFTALLSGHGLRVRWAGMTSYCGAAAAFVAAYLVLRRHDAVSLPRFGDLLAAPLGVAIAIARMGCFVAGCDYGQVSAAPWAVRFPAGSPAWSAHVSGGLMPASRDASLPVHPTQLYEVLLGLLIFVIAWRLARLSWARRGHGRVFLAVTAVYGVGRLIIEMLRGDAGRGLVGSASSGQIFAFLLILAAVIALWRVRRAAVVAAALALALLLPAPPARADIKILSYEVGLLVGTAMPLNRRPGQVPQLGGGSLTGNLELYPGLRVGVDLDSVSSSVASHVSIGVSGTFLRPVHSRLEVGAYGGLGSTRVNFTDASFRDVATMHMRMGVAAVWSISEPWKVLVRPLSLDLFSAAAIGGPVMSYQFHVGVAYRFGAASAPAQPEPDGA